MSRPRGVDEELRKLFIGGLGRNVTEEGFVEYFAQWGQMSDSVIIKDSNGQSKGFGFVTYETVEQTDTCLAVKKGKGHKLGGKDIEVKRAIPRDMSEDPEQTQKNTRMFIGGLGQDLCEDQIKSYFEDNFSCAVEVVDLIKEKKDSVPQGQTPRLRGFGFITFEDCDIVDKLCIMKSHEIDGRTVTVRKAAPRGAQGSSSRDDIGYGGNNNDRRGPRNDGYNGGNQIRNQGGYGGNQGRNYSRNQRGGYNQRCYEGNQGGGYGGNQGGYDGNQGGYRGNKSCYGGNQGGGYGGNQGGGYGGNQGGGYGGNQGGGYGGNQGGGYGGNQGGGYGGNQGGGYGRQNNGGGPQRSNGGGRGGYRPY